MIIPLEKLIGNQTNAYELTCAIIKRANQISLTQEVDAKRNEKKFIAEGMEQILSGKIDYQNQE